MWPFLLILAIVPMIYFWSDSVVEMFPQLSALLPDKDGGAKTVFVPKAADNARAGGESGKWFISTNESGYVAWVISEDGDYRLAVGCRPGSPPVLQVTHILARKLPFTIILNYQYGTLPLEHGAYSGADLIGAAAQLKTVYLQSRSTEVIAQFEIPMSDSNLVARDLQTQCAADL